MKSNEFVTEEASTGQNDYQQMQNFIRANQTPGIPAEQQVALALFRELQKQKQQNQNLSSELQAAEKRIDVAAQGSELATQQLGKHQAALDQEKDEIEQQRGAMDKIDQKNAERETASQKQIQHLTAMLDQVKSKPGVSKTEAENLEKQIQQLTKNSAGMSIERVKEIERTVTVVQDMQKVDDKVMQDLIAKVNNAQAATQELEKTKQNLGKDADDTARQALDQIEMIKQQLAHFKEVEQTVDDLDNNMRVIAPRVNQIARAQIKPYADDTVQMARSAIDNNPAQMSLPGVETPAAPTQRQAAPPAPRQNMDPEKAMAMAKMVRTAPQINLQQAQAPQIHEDAKLLKSIKWATGK